MRSILESVVTNQRFYLYVFCLLPMIVAGCTPPAGYKVDADRVATAIIHEKQMQGLGRTEPFSVETPADTLRRRLLLDQQLPVSHPGSLGSGDLEKVPHWSAKLPPVTGGTSDDGISIPAKDMPLKITLDEALQIAARNSREYISAKEDVFRAALDLDLERDEFRTVIAAVVESEISTDRGGATTITGVENRADVSLSRNLKTGGQIAAQLAIDLVKLLTMDRSSSLGQLGDATISIPLLRGAGRHIAIEPLTQAERNVLYAIWTFERFKRTFAVQVASDYLAVLQQLDQLTNSAENYRQLIASARRARRLADAGRLPEIQVDQAVQNKLLARNSWVSAQQSYTSALDAFKISLGLPTDSRLELDRAELARLVEAASRLISKEDASTTQGETIPPADAAIELPPPDKEHAGPYEFDEKDAIALALKNRLDLRTAQEQVYDAQRAVIVAADNLRAELTLLGSASLGEARSLATAGQPDARLQPDKGLYSALLSLDLPLHRVAERNVFRESYLDLQKSVRDLQLREDQVKLDIRNRLRDLLVYREGVNIQAQSVQVAKRRVASTNLFLQAGRAEIRDLLEAQEALVTAQNGLSSAVVSYRIAELDLQRDMGLLQVNEKGLWKEYQPGEHDETSQ
jgi:outer membrane protein TolC